MVAAGSATLRRCWSAEMGSEALEVLNTLFRSARATLQDDRRELLKRYQIIDIAHKVVGVGSVGLLAWVLLMQGRDESDLMVLQVKQAQASVLEAYTTKSVYAKHGHRVVTGQRLMQAASDSFLGWIDGRSGRSFYVRQLRDMKWSPEPSTLDQTEAPGLRLPVRAHPRPGPRRSGDAVALATYMGADTTFDKAIGGLPMAYADTAAADYAAFMAAIADGRVVAHEGNEGSEAKEAIEALRVSALRPSAAKHK